MRSTRTGRLGKFCRSVRRYELVSFTKLGPVVTGWQAQVSAAVATVRCRSIAAAPAPSYPAYGFRMRRRLCLRVLCWPTLASAAVVIALVWGSGLFEQQLQLFAVKLGRANLADMANAPSSGVARHSHDRFTEVDGMVEAEWPPSQLPPTLLSAPGEFTGLHPAISSAIPREQELVSHRTDFSHRAVAARAALLPATPLASAELRAPRRHVDEELAGLDRETALRAPVTLQLASAAVVNQTDRSTSFAVGSRAHVSDGVGTASAGLEASQRSRHGIGSGWPDAPQLTYELRRVASLAGTPRAGTVLVKSSAGATAEFDFEDWQQEVARELDRLQQLPSIASKDSAAILTRLAALAESGCLAAETVEDRATQVACLSAAHALQRRVAVWTAAHRATTAASTWVGDDEGSWASREQVEGFIQHVERDVAASEDPEGWQRYLLLEELAKANYSDDQTERRMAAQRFLSRLSWYGLTPTQQAWIKRDSVEALQWAVRRWAVAPVDYAALLGQLERQESDAIDLGAIDVARAVQSLRFASSREAVELADAIDTYYRNANIRLAVTDTLINRLLPDVDTRIDPIRQRILGADVRGQSHVDSRVAVRLIPSPSTWQLQLETLGQVRAATASRSGPVSIHTGSRAEFVSTTPLEIGRLSVTAGGTAVSVDSQTRLRGVETDYDSVPLIGSLVREIALSRYQSLAPQAKQIQQGQIRSEVSSEIDERLNSQLNEASDRFTRHLVGPLGSLGLSPMVVDMQTTSQRLTARYRIGGDWQLAAFTPRPRAPSDSLLSLQVHQSALNNTLETILPAGQAKSIEEITTHLKQLFALEQLGLPNDEDDEHELAADTQIQFAATRPVTIEIEDDLLWITLRVMRLSREGGIDLRRFIVRAAYRCEVDGLSARLVRDGHLRISGPGMSMRDRLPVRAIFNKVFSTRRPIPLTPPRLAEHPAMEGLAITQLELRDGWIGLAIGPEATPRVARKD